LHPQRLERAFAALVVADANLTLFCMVGGYDLERGKRKIFTILHKFFSDFAG
jgi:hypothetical protein